MSFVNIVASDRGWILEKLANEITSRLTYVKFGDGVQSDAAIQYYLTYSCRHRRVSPVEVAFFAHLEPDGEAHSKFFATAGEIEHCVTMSALYASMLQDAGNSAVTTISPGVDLTAFAPKLRIGVVGRAYHTGRKGEHLVAQVMDIPEIEWSFTGEGWPEPALNLSNAALPDFYRSLDYVLVPALYEGGPMCVLEALACGTEIIAPAVGWVADFPHHEYAVGDVDDLRRVLLGILAKKRALRDSVRERTWEGWAAGHDRLFRDLADTHGLSLAAPPATNVHRFPSRVGLFLHGSEGKSPGGPTVRVPRLAQELREAGTEARVVHYPGADLGAFDIVHAVNVWHPRSALDLLRRARYAHRAIVFSPIFMELGRRALWQEALPRLFAEAAGDAALEAALAQFRRDYDAAGEGDALPPEPVPGFRAAVCEMVALADHVIYLSEGERRRLARIGAVAAQGSVIHNPVDWPLFAGGDAAMFEDEYGVKDFVLCVARQEPRKNQLMLMQALKHSNIPLVLVGHAAAPGYRELMQRYRTANVHVIERLPPNSPMLAAAYAAARVAVLASWAEGAPLAALEAAASGTALVLGDESGESEYFGAHARYCNPASVASIRHAVLDAYETVRPPAAIAAQQDFVARTYNWDRHQEQTRNVYRDVYAAHAPPPERLLPERAAVAAVAGLSIVYDVTTSAHHSGRWTGIARVEAALALALQDSRRVRSIRFVAWNNKAQCFVEIPFDAIRAGKTRTLLGHYDDVEPQPLDLPAGAFYIVPGSGWMQNASYVEGIVALRNRHRLLLTPISYDLIPIRFPFWFNDGYAPVFGQNLEILLGNADRILAISQWTRREIGHYLNRTPDVFVPEVDVFRLGDDIGQVAATGPAQSAVTEQLSGRAFILCVGAIHQRKNHKLLYDVWVKLRERMGGRCPKLVIVGGIAWNGQDLVRALKGDERVRDQIHVLEDIDDVTLAWLYGNCLFTVYPSLHEGWGLPVCESLHHGKLCIASNASSIPEIAPDFTELLDPLDTSLWLAKIQFYASSAAARAAREAKIASTYRGFSWHDSAAAVIDILQCGATRPPPKRLYTPGTVISLGNRLTAALHKQSGWHLTEAWGCWAASQNAVLSFEIAQPFDGDAVLIAEVQAMLFPGTSVDARILVNGVAVTRWRVAREGLHIRHALLPLDHIRGASVITVEIQTATLMPIAQLAKSADRRSISLGVGRLALAPAALVADAYAYLGGTVAEAPQQIHVGQTYDFLRDSGARACLEGQWTLHSAWGAFNAAMRPRLSLMIGEALGADLTVTLFLRVAATAELPLTLIALVNHVQCGNWTLADDQVHCIELAVPRHVRNAAEPMVIDLIAHDAHSPQTAGVGTLAQAFAPGLIQMTVTAAGLPSRSHMPYRIGAPLLLTKDAALPEAARAALVGPWYNIEKDGVWSFGPLGRVALQLVGAPASDLILTCELSVFAARGEGAAVTVAANGQPIGTLQLRRGVFGSAELLVPGTLLGPRQTLQLDFAMACAVSPFRLGEGMDERLLGIRLRSLSLRAAFVLRPGRLLAFRLADAQTADMVDAGPVIGGQWFPAELSGRWSRGGEGRLVVVRPPGPVVRTRLFVVVRVSGASAQQPVVVDIEVDGLAIDSWLFHSDKSALIELRGLAAVAGPLETELLICRRGARSPEELGLGHDTRALGVKFKGLLVAAPGTTPAAAAQLFEHAGIHFEQMLRETADDDAAAGPRDGAATAAAGAGAGVRALGAASRYDSAVHALSGGVDTTEHGGADTLLLKGWYPTEAGGTWSQASRADLRVPVQRRAAGWFVVELLARVFGTRFDGPARVLVSAGGELVTELVFDSDAVTLQRFRMERSLVDADDELVLTIRRLAPVIPAIAGVSADQRELGIFLKYVRVVHDEPA